MNSLSVDARIMRTAVFLTNIPAPYREPVHQLASERLAGKYHVIYCASTESKRQWNFELGQYKRTFLNQKKLTINGNDYYLPSKVNAHLRALNPGCIIIAGFSAPMLQAALWGLANRVPVVGFSDCNVNSESRRPFYKKAIRHLLVPHFAANIGVGEGTKELFSSYGAKAPYFFSYLCANNKLHASQQSDDREFDLITCGRICHEKEYPFLLSVLAELAQRQPLRLLVVGDGPYRGEFLQGLKQIPGLTFEFAGFVEPNSLYKYYPRAKLMLFPTQSDTWGVVANEAMASSTPVICSPEAGVAGELVLHDSNGLVLEKNLALWVESIVALLNDSSRWHTLSAAAYKDVQKYSYENAAAGIVACVEKVGI